MNVSDMMKTEALCVEEHAPRCRAACPLHLDARAMLGHLAKGEAEKAAALLFALPLPRTIAALCDAPCQAACRRGDVDGAVAVHAVEQALAAYGESPAINPRLKLKHRAAVVGGGACGLTAAHYLAAKGIGVTVFEAGDTLFPHAGAGLSREALAADVAPLLPHVAFEAGREIAGAGDWEALFETFGAVLATGSLPPGCPAGYDPGTFQSPFHPKLFIGGRKLTQTGSISLAMGNARRAAVSMERLVKRVSLTAMRANEGPYESGLYTPVEGTPPMPPVEAPRPWGLETARQEAARCLDCHCLACVRECKFMQKFEKFPRLYIREIANTISLVGSGMRSGKNLLTACSLCGLCQELCPNAIPMAQIVRGGRAMMRDKGELSDAIYDFPVRDMLYANSEEAALFRHAPGQRASEYVFFPGCQLIGGEPGLVKETYAHLLSVRPATGIALCCCGAPADWAGRAALYNQTMLALKERLAALGNPTAIAACPTCLKQLAAAGVPAISLYEVLAQAPLPKAERAPVEAAVHDPCAARHERGAQDAVRSLMERCGYAARELPMGREKTRCCGYGGLVFYGDKEVARAMIGQRAGESPLPYVTYCSVCRDYLARAGKPCLHVLDVLFGQDGPGRAARPGADISQKEANRARLRAELLATLYGEPAEPPPEPGLAVSPAVAARMEERLVTRRMAARAIQAAEESGQKLLRPDNGHFIASLRPGIVTYWVEYAQTAAGYEVHDAYSHRVHIYRGEGAAEGFNAVPIENGAGVLCVPCGETLAPAQVRAAYLKSDFPTRVLACPACGQIYIPWDLVRGKIAEVERTLEEK